MATAPSSEPRVSLENTLTTEFRWICSLEHGTTDAKPPSETSATPDKPGATKATQASAATPTEFMAETPLKPLKAVLATIREQADFALKQLQKSEEERSTRWRCKDCKYTNHFTRPRSIRSSRRMSQVQKHFVSTRPLNRTVSILRQIDHC